MFSAERMHLTGVPLHAIGTRHHLDVDLAS